MRINLFKSLWGIVSEDGGRHSVEHVLASLRRSGYTGVECSVKLAYVLNSKGSFQSLMRDHDLEWIPIIFSSGPVNGWNPFISDGYHVPHRSSASQHQGALLRQLEDAQKLASGFRMPHVTSHTGHDSFREAEMVDLVQLLPAVEDAAGVPVIHEIHRGRMLSNPWHIARLLGHIRPPSPSLASPASPTSSGTSKQQVSATDQPAPATAQDLLSGATASVSSAAATAAGAAGIKLVGDFSHFTCACEVEPWDPDLLEALKPLMPHIHHLHARVGYENGPQVPDPRCPTWARHVEVFEALWVRSMVNMLRVKGEVSVTMEYGPPSYQHTLPFTEGKPAADIEEVNNWTAARVKGLLARAESML